MPLKRPSAVWLLVLLPVYLLLLDAFPGFLRFFADQAVLPPAVQLILPRSLPPNQPYTLQGTLLSPLSRRPVPARKLQLKLTGGPQDEVLFLPVQTRTDGSWSVTLPELSAGFWRFQLTVPEGDILLVDAPLRIETPLRIQWTVDRRVMHPWERFWATAHLAQGTQPLKALPLELCLRYQGQFLQRKRVQSNAWGSVVHEMILPEQAVEGTYQLELRVRGRVLAVQSLQVKMPASEQQDELVPLRVEPVFSRLLKGQAQQLVLSVTDAVGREVPSAWLRYQGHEVPVRGRFAVLPLTAAQIQPEIPLTVGDAQGHLLRLRLPLSLSSQGVALQPVVNEQGVLTTQWRIYAAQADLWTYAWGIAAEVKQQGQIALQVGENRVDLPVSGHAPSWLLFYLRSMPEPHWLQLQPRPGLAGLSIRPARPDALSALSLNTLPELKLHFPVQAQVLLSRVQPAQAPLTQPLPRQAVFQPGDAVLSVPGLYTAATLFFAMMLVFAQLPLFWLLRQIWLLYRSQREVPVPSALALRRLKYGLFTLQILLALLLAGLVLFWGSGFQLLSIVPTLLSLLPALVLSVAAGVLGFYLLPVWRSRLPQAPVWILLWTLLQLILLWFLNLYQPVFLAAFWLTTALALWGLVMGVRHLFLPSRFRPEDQRQAWSLSALTVLSLIQLVLFSRGVPFFRELEPPVFPAEICWRESLLLEPQTLPLTFREVQWPAPEQALKLSPVFASGEHLLQVTLQDAQGHWLQNRLPVTLQPAVLGGIHGPAYALQGDSLQLAVRFNNETAQAQAVKFRLLGQPWQTLQLSAGETRLIWQRFDCRWSGPQSLALEQEWQGRLNRREFPLYILPPQVSVPQPDLHLKIEAPVTRDLVPGEEVPVQVRLAHRSSRPQALGLQLGVPSGYQPLLETLSDRQVRHWLVSVKRVPGYIQIQTRPLPPGQELSFHYRLRLWSPGEVRMPAAQLFFLEAPERYLSDTQMPVFSARKIAN